MIYNEVTIVPLDYWNGFLKAPSLSAKDYFTQLFYLLSTIECFQFFWIFSKHKIKIVDLFNQTAVCNAHPSSTMFKKTWQKIYIYIILVYVSNITLSVATFFSVSDIQSLQTGMESPITIFKVSMIDGKNRFYFQYKTSNTEYVKGIPLSEFAPSEILLGIMELWIQLCTTFVHLCIDIWFIGPLPVTMWLRTTYFMNTLATQEFKPFSSTLHQMISENYEHLKKFSKDFNNIWGLALLIWLFEASLRVILLLNSIILSRNTIHIISHLSSFFFTAIAITLLCEVCKKVVTYKYIQKNILL